MEMIIETVRRQILNALHDADALAKDGAVIGLFGAGELFWRYEPETGSLRVTAPE